MDNPTEAQIKEFWEKIADKVEVFANLDSAMNGIEESKPVLLVVFLL